MNEASPKKGNHQLDGLQGSDSISHSLPIAPARRSPEIRSGQWLVQLLNFPSWGDDVNAKKLPVSFDGNSRGWIVQGNKRKTTNLTFQPFVRACKDMFVCSL